MRLKSSKETEPKKPSTPERREMHIKLGLLMIAVLISLLGFSIVIPLTPFYIKAALGASATDQKVGFDNGWLIAVYAIMQFLFAPFWGRLSDNVGRKPILVMSLIGDVVFYTLFGLSTHSIYGQFASRILAGIFSSATLSVASAYVADVTPPEERAVGLGMIGAVFGVGFILGPAIGGALGSINLSLPMYVAAALALINVGYIIKVLPESRTAEVRAQHAAESHPPSTPWQRFGLMIHGLSGPVGFLYLLTFLVTFSFGNLEGTFTTYVAQNHNFVGHNSVGTVGGVFAYVGILITLIQGGAIRPLVKRYGETVMILAGVFLMAVGFLTFSLAHSLIWLMIGPLLPIAVGSGLNSPALRALVSKKSAASNQGGALGIYASFDSLARALGPATGGFLYSRFGPTSPYLFAGVTMLVAFLFAVSQRSALKEASVVPTAPVTETATTTGTSQP